MKKTAASASVVFAPGAKISVSGLFPGAATATLHCLTTVDAGPSPTVFGPGELPHRFPRGGREEA
jgi:hypothetical protein